MFCNLSFRVFLFLRFYIFLKKADIIIGQLYIHTNKYYLWYLIYLLSYKCFNFCIVPGCFEMIAHARNREFRIFDIPRYALTFTGPHLGLPRSINLRRQPMPDVKIIQRELA